MSNSFTHNRAKKNAARGAKAIIVAITVISMVSSYHIYKPAFDDVGGRFQIALALFAVGAVEGCFLWLLYGLQQAFTARIERGIAYLGMASLLGVMFTNVITHGMMSKGYSLTDFQRDWLMWGAYGVLLGILLLVVCITWADSAVRLLWQELKDQGAEEQAVLRARSRQRQAITEAQEASLNSKRIQTAMQNRANSEAEALALRIEGEGGYVNGDVTDYRAGLNGHPQVVFANRSDDRGKADRSASKR